MAAAGGSGRLDSYCGGRGGTRSGFVFDYFQERLQITQSVCSAAVAVCRVIDEAGDMVVDDKAAESHLFEFTEDGQDVAVSLVNEALAEVFRAALHVPHVHIEDSAVATEEIDGIQDSLAAAHLAPAAVAKVQPVHRARMCFHSAPESLNRAEYARN